MLELLAGTFDLGLEHGEFGNLGADELLPRAQVLAVVEELEYLNEAEAGVLPHANHSHPIHRLGRVATLAGFPRRWRKEAFALVETNRRDGRSCFCGKFSDSEANNHLT